MFTATLKITAAGRALLAKCHNGAEMHFTRVKIGSGELGTTDADTLTDVIAEEAACELSSVKRTGAETFVKFVFRNENTKPFYFREMALMAEDPDAGEIAYMYANDGDNAEQIPVSGTTSLERGITIDVIVSADINVTAELPSGAFVQRSEFEAHVVDTDIHVTKEEKTAWNRKVGVGEDGKIPTSVLPSLDFVPTAEKGKAKGVASLGDDGMIPASQVDAFSKEQAVSSDVKELLELASDATPSQAFAAIAAMIDGNAKIAYGISTGGAKIRIDVDFTPTIILFGNTELTKADVSVSQYKSFMIAWRGNSKATAFRSQLYETVVDNPYGGTVTFVTSDIETALEGAGAEQSMTWGDSYIEMSGEVFKYSGKYPYVIIGVKETEA